jgi:hypothetical protein
VPILACVAIVGVIVATVSAAEVLAVAAAATLASAAYGLRKRRVPASG